MSYTPSTRPHPHVHIPSSQRPHSVIGGTPIDAWVPNISDPTPTTATPYTFLRDQRAAPDAGGYLSPDYTYMPQGASHRNGHASLSRPASFSAGYNEANASLWQFPEPEVQIHRSVSHQATIRPGASPTQQPPHRNTRSEAHPYGHAAPSGASLERDNTYKGRSTSSSSYTPEGSEEGPSDELSGLSLESEDGLYRFQAGKLSAENEEWHRLVPEIAREALGKNEVQRQSVIFEVFKGEKDYVADLEAIRDVFINPLRHADVIPKDRLDTFIREVFWNLDEIITFHQRMLVALFARQREQHPVVHSVADIILETALMFRPAYDTYIQHYPIAEACHRKELKRNLQYQSFVQTCMQDPRIKKRDLITFIARPVTRLPRLSLVLEHLHKLTGPDHPDQETLPLILTILSDFIKSTQPGIEAAESKVKFWSLCESLVFRTSESIDMDLYDDSRTLMYQGPLARRQRSEVDWHGWNDYDVALLDNYLLITREERRRDGSVKRHVVSRPIPLSFLCLGQFNAPPESRKEKADDGKLLESFRYHSKPMYPFTIYHAADKANRRYTLFTASEALRQKWQNILVETIGVHKIRQDANQWFVPHILDDGFFKMRKATLTTSTKGVFTGKVTAATMFTTSKGRRYLAVGCGTGIYVGERGTSGFRKALMFQNPVAMISLQEYNKFIVQIDSGLLSYSIDILARVSLGQAPPKALDDSLERLAGQDGTVTSFRAGRIANRTIVVYASRSFRQTTIEALEAISPSQIQATTRRHGNRLYSFRSFGNPFYVPRQAFDITLLTRTVAIATERGIMNVDPTNLSTGSVLAVPDFDAAASDERVATLKSRCDDSKPLGLARANREEILVIYEDFGCYVTRHGKPTRSASISRWETKAVAYARRNDNILLFSGEFIEVRNIPTGRLVQVLEGTDVRLLHSGPPDTAPVLVAWRGKGASETAENDEIVELVETADLTTPSVANGNDAIWDEWDM